MKVSALLLIVIAAAAWTAAPMFAAEEPADAGPKDPAQSFEEALQDGNDEGQTATQLADDDPQKNTDKPGDDDEYLPATQPADGDPQENTDKPDDDEAKADDEPEAALNVEADQIIYEGDTFTCTKNVVITYGDARIECDNVIGTLGEVEKEDEKTGEKTKEKAITHLVATGSPVKMTSKERRARCHKAVYDLIERKIVLTGTEEDLPELTQEGGTFQGKTIRYLIDKRKFILDEGSEVTIPIPGGKLPEILE